MNNIENVLLENEMLRKQIIIMQESFFWKITSPCRKFMDFIKDTKKKIFFHPLKNAYMKFIWAFRHGNLLPYQAFGLTNKKYIIQKNQVFNTNVHFSVILVLHNSTIKYLKESLASVRTQTYGNWDLNILDFSDDNCQKRKKTCEKISDKDSRIKYTIYDSSIERITEVNRCANMAEGEYIFVLNQNDILHPSAFFEIADSVQKEKSDFIYADEITFSKSNLHKIQETYFKSDFAPEYFYSTNYIRHCVVFKRELLKDICNYDVLLSYDLYIRLLEKTDKIFHIKKCLYFERGAKEIQNSFFLEKSNIEILKEHFKRIGIDASVSEGLNKNCCKITYPIIGQPLVSIIIPSCDHWKTLRTCIESIKKSTWQNYEIVIVENNSKDSETFKYYESLKNNPKIKVVYWKNEFNYSEINNFGFESTNGDHIILLNNDIEVISANWIEEMLMYSQQTEIGAVGAKLYFPSGRIQHAGLVTNAETVGHLFRFYENSYLGDNGRLNVVQNYSAVTAACMMIPRNVYQQIGGLDEIYRVAYNDVDLCLKIRKCGYRIVWTPYAELYHYESESRGKDDTVVKKIRIKTEYSILKKRWQQILNNGDPYYNMKIKNSIFFDF